jgi:hypothetical protein
MFNYSYRGLEVASTPASAFMSWWWLPTLLRRTCAWALTWWSWMVQPSLCASIALNKHTKYDETQNLTDNGNAPSPRPRPALPCLTKRNQGNQFLLVPWFYYITTGCGIHNIAQFLYTDRWYTLVRNVNYLLGSGIELRGLVLVNGREHIQTVSGQHAVRNSLHFSRYHLW